MNVQSLSFIWFLAATVFLCGAAGRRDLRIGRLALAAACLIFALWAGPAGVLVLCAGLCVTAWTVRHLAGEGGRRRCWLAAACGYHLAVLCVFKYLGFFTGGAVSMGWAPLGLSFFTFQQLWLLKEVYTRQYVPVPGDSLVLYGLFFPTLVSGPILRPDAFFPQLRGESFLRPDARDAAAGMYAISVGMAKKVLLADALGTVADNGWAMLADLTAPAAWLVMLAYTLQLYLDFSGYCDIAAGCGRLLGIRLPLNFRTPYRALSVGEFWKRWHITLTTFLRECVYFPLGGSRKGSARTYGNIVLVFLLSGLWHGAGWTFLVWGLLHGLAQVAERIWGSRRERLPKAVQWLLTFLFVNLAWIFFRAPSLSAAGALLAAGVSGGAGLPAAALTAGVLESEVTALQTVLPQLKGWMPWLVLLGLLSAGLVVSLRPQETAERLDGLRLNRRSAVLCGVLLAWAVLSFSNGTAFIYSNF